MTIFDYEDDDDARDVKLLELRKDMVAFGCTDGFDPNDDITDLFWDVDFKLYMKYLSDDIEKLTRIMQFNKYLKNKHLRRLWLAAIAQKNAF